MASRQSPLLVLTALACAAFAAIPLGVSSYVPAYGNTWHTYAAMVGRKAGAHASLPLGRTLLQGGEGTVATDGGDVAADIDAAAAEADALQSRAQDAGCDALREVRAAVLANLERLGALSEQVDEGSESESATRSLRGRITAATAVSQATLKIIERKDCPGGALLEWSIRACVRRHVCLHVYVCCRSHAAAAGRGHTCRSAYSPRLHWDVTIADQHCEACQLAQCSELVQNVLWPGQERLAHLNRSFRAVSRCSLKCPPPWHAWTRALRLILYRWAASLSLEARDVFNSSKTAAPLHVRLPWRRILVGRVRALPSSLAPALPSPSVKVLRLVRLALACSMKSILADLVCRTPSSQPLERRCLCCLFPMQLLHVVRTASEQF